MRRRPWAGALVLVVLSVLVPVSHAAGYAPFDAGIPLAAATNLAGDEAVLYRDGQDLKVIERAAGGTWSGPHLLSPASRADLGLDGAGNITVVREADSGMVADHEVNGVWGDPIPLESSAGWGVTGSEVSLEVNEGGAAVATYVGGTNGIPVKAVYRPAGGSWGQPVLLTSSAYWWGGAVIDAAGLATVAWIDKGVGVRILRTTTSSAAGEFSAPTDVRTAAPIESADLAGNAAGDIVVGWTESASDTITHYVSIRPAGGLYADAVTLASGSTTRLGASVSVGILPGGDVAAMWFDRPTDDSETLVTTEYDTASGTWSEPTTPVQADKFAGDSSIVIGAHDLAPLAEGRWRLTWLEGATSTTLYTTSWSGSDPLPPLPTTVQAVDGPIGDPYSATDLVVAQSPARGTGLVAWTQLQFVPYGQELYLTTVGPAPLAPAASAAMVQPTHNFTGSRSVPAAWQGSGARVASYVVARKAAGPLGAWPPYSTLLQTTQTSASFTGDRGSTYCLRVRAVDHDGVSAPASKGRCTAVPLDDRDLVRAGIWRRVSVGGAYGGSVLRSTHRGATLSLRVSTRRLALRVRTCPGCGTFEVRLGGTVLGKFTLAGPHGFRILDVASLPNSSTGELMITVRSSGQWVVIDSVRSSRAPS